MKVLLLSYSIHRIPLTQLLIGQILVCHQPNPIELIIITVTVGGILVGSGISAIGITYVASTVITMLIAGASIEAISAAIATMLSTLTTITASLELVALLVNAVKAILGC